MAFLGYEYLKAREFVGLSTFQFLAFFRRLLFYGFVAVYLGVEMQLTTVQVTLMATFGMIANTGSQSFVWGPLLDRFNRSALFVVIGELIAGLGHVFLYFWHLAALQTGDLRYAGFTIIIGLAAIEVFWSQSNVGWSTLISELTAVNQRKKLMSQLSIIGGIGGIAGATTGGLLYMGGTGFQNGYLFFIPAAIMMASGILVYLVMGEPNVEVENNRVKTDEPVKLGNLPRRLIRLYILFLASLIFINFGRNSIALISSLYVVDVGAFGATDQQLATFRNVSAGATMITGFLLGSIFATMSDTRVFLSGILFALIALVWFILAPSFQLVLLASALSGATQVIIQASSYSIMAEIIPEEYRGRLFAYYNSTFMLSWGIGGTLIAAPVADFFINRGYTSAFSYQMSFVSAIVVVSIGLLLFIVFRPRLHAYQREMVEIAV
ncbi:MAG: MFS transporter [Candidatus Kariarchaeaceae archaeon]